MAQARKGMSRQGRRAKRRRSYPQGPRSEFYSEIGSSQGKENNSGNSRTARKRKFGKPAERAGRAEAQRSGQPEVIVVATRKELFVAEP
jgi:hypothetical protein